MKYRRISLRNAVALHQLGVEVYFSTKGYKATLVNKEQWTPGEYSAELQSKLHEYRFYVRVE